MNKYKITWKRPAKPSFLKSSPNGYSWAWSNVTHDPDTDDDIVASEVIKGETLQTAMMNMTIEPEDNEWENCLITLLN